MYPHHMLNTGVCWLLRGAELADLLGEQAQVLLREQEADLDLCATKTDPAGRGCHRTLRCLCPSGQAGPCPFCTLKDLLEARERDGFGPKDPLFPTRTGKAAGNKAVIKTLCRLLKRTVTEHSLRREGCQMLARRQVHLYLIQFLGRWGGPTVWRYVSEALRGQLALASAAKAAGQPIAEQEVSGQLRKTLKELIAEALAKQSAASPLQAAPVETDPVAAAFISALELPGVPDLPAVRKVVRRQGEREVGPMHDTLVCDPSIEPAAWVTRCTWRFGHAEHTVYDQAETTCLRCLQHRLKAAGRVGAR